MDEDHEVLRCGDALVVEEGKFNRAKQERLRDVDQTLHAPGRHGSRAGSS